MKKEKNKNKEYDEIFKIFIKIFCFGLINI